MEQKKSPKIPKIFSCEKCNYICSNKKDYNKHLLTAKHKMERLEQQKSPKIPKIFSCDCGKTYKSASGLWKHKKVCANINNIIVVPENREEKPSIVDIISQNREIIDLLVLQNEELKRQNKEQSETIKELIPKIGNNTTNNNFNLQIFLNEDCKDALNFSEFIEKIQVSFEDLENQAEYGYIKGISKLFIENLQELGTHKRPIHCTDKKRNTLYIKENNSWDKEGSQDSLKKGIQEVTRKTQKKLLEEKENNSEEYTNTDSEFFEKCINIQRNLTPDAPRDTTINKVIENISNKSGVL